MEVLESSRGARLAGAWDLATAQRWINDKIFLHIASSFEIKRWVC